MFATRCPEVQEYKLYYAQSLFKAGLYEPAMKACQNVDETDEQGRGKVLKLQARQHPRIEAVPTIDHAPQEKGGKGGSR
jgi:hypothetical protein